jgi:hypothetical protein
MKPNNTKSEEQQRRSLRGKGITYEIGKAEP